LNIDFNPSFIKDIGIDPNNLLYRFYCREVYFTYKSLGLNLPFLLVEYYKINEFKEKPISFFKRLKKSL